ncbi:MAG TPA: apolipoprotein N-acyltransferase [Alphaproteobacteria bacterium]|jgi:apolipoprotein N-acyltransferase|nr:apolipoprotein N-acyltransferase [Alphaproteobacteria bacterium]
MTDENPGLGPILRLADGCRRLTGWRRNLSAFAAGCVASISLPPADVLPLLWIAFPILVWLLDGVKSRKGAFWVGWLFGFGYLAFSLYWLTFALFVAIDQYWWAVPFASSGLSFGLSIYWGIATWLATYVPRERPVARVLTLVAGWCLAEWVRGHALTGFPWNLPGYAWTEFPWLIQSAAWIGIYGVTVLVILPPALASLLGNRHLSARRGRIAAAAGLALVALAAIVGAIRMPAGPMPTVENVRIRLVQPSIEQSLKWVEGRYDQNVRRHVVLSVPPADPMPNVIIWSEAAEPFPLSDPDNAKTLGSILKPGQLLITGTDRAVPEEGALSFRDSIQVLDPAGNLLGTYDKFHYVPFGEYMPLAKWIPMVKAVAAGNGDPMPGPGPVTMTLPGLPPVGMLICYEVIFPGEVVEPGKRPDWLLDVTNDAWFGFSAGPYQHFAMMRVRSVEEGLPLANAANDGISGVVDPYGRLTARMGLGKIAYLDADLPKPLPPTVFSKVGDIPFFVMVGLLILAGLLAGRGGMAQRPPL